MPDDNTLPLVAKDTTQTKGSIKGLIFNIQRFSIHDGPGIRTTVFMKGCPLQCQWCSNPESQQASPEILTLDRNCIKCGKCVEACPQDAITMTESGRSIDRNKCDRCLECALVCPAEAIQIVGKYMRIDEVISEVVKDRIFYQNSGGGVTVSGGEPLLQWEFVRELLRKCKARNLHTVLDTSGYAPWKVIEEVLRYTDLVLYDVKLLDSARHQAATGVTNEIILANAAKVARSKRTWLRYAVIPGFNDSESCTREIAAFASSLPFEKVSLLPYHAMATQKYERLGREYTCEGISPPTSEHLKQIAQIFESSGVNITIGY